MTIWFHPEAETEHLETVAYYETRRSGLGSHYLAAFEQALNAVRTDTPRFRIVQEPDIRRAPLVRFPLSIIYRGDEGEDRDTRRGSSQAEASLLDCPILIRRVRHQRR